MARRVRGGTPHPIDSHIGLRVRALRKERGLSLDALAAALGIAYQQVQKYETGANRISAGALYGIARALRAPVGYFYAELEAQSGDPPLQACAPSPADALMASPGGGGLARAYLAMTPRLRRALLTVAEAIGPEAEAAEADRAAA